MQALVVARPPAKLNYENGEKLDLEDLVVQGTRTGATSIELVDISRLKVSGYDRFKGGNQTVTITLGGKTATFRVTVGSNPFVGTWHGMGDYSSMQSNDEYPVTLIMSEDSWSVSWPKTEKVFEDEYGGTYTRDSDSGKHAELLLKKFDRNSAATAAELLSLNELKLTGGTFGRDGLILTK
jgi:hypothetical protein